MTAEELDWLLSPITEDFTQLFKLGFKVEKDACIGVYVASKNKINVTGKADELMYHIILSYQALVMYYEKKKS